MEKIASFRVDPSTLEPGLEGEARKAVTRVSSRIAPRSLPVVANEFGPVGGLRGRSVRRFRFGRFQTRDFGLVLQTQFLRAQIREAAGQGSVSFQRQGGGR